jgi:TRAP-type C4-dicarboxylate transport system permease small subunit
MRSALDGLYRVCAGAAACFLALIAALVVAQVAGRLAGVLVPGADDLASFSLTAASFLALAPTLRAGVHIRMTLLLRRAPPAWRRTLELGCLAFGAAVTGYFAFHVVEMAWDAYRYGEMSMGTLPIPLWIPQAGMALGVIVLGVAFADELVQVARSGAPSYPEDQTLIEEWPGPRAGEG